MARAQGGAYGANSIDGVHAFDNFAEHTVTPAFGVLRGMVKEAVVFNVDENCAVAEWGSMVRAMPPFPACCSGHYWLRS